MKTASMGDTVKVFYVGTFDNGEEFDSNINDEPLEFTIGQHQLIEDFEKAVEGMNVGDTKKIHVLAKDGYGEYDETAVVNIPRGEFPPQFQPEIGQVLELPMEGGAVIPVVITEVNDEIVTLDANHPLAGQDLNFAITLESIK